MVLHHIRRTTACIPISIVNARFRNHVLPQIISSYVHQFAGIQRAAAQMRLPRRMCGPTVKPVQHADTRQAAAAIHSVFAGRVPGESPIQFIKYAFFCHMHFTAAIFFRRAAVINHRSSQPLLLHILFHCQRRCQRTNTQLIMPAAVAGRTVFEQSSLGVAGLLAQIKQRIILAQKSNDRFSTAVSGHKSRRYSGDAFFKGKPLVFQTAFQRLSRPKFLKSYLSIAPDLLAQRRELLPLFLNIPIQNVCQPIQKCHSLRFFILRLFYCSRLKK